MKELIDEISAQMETFRENAKAQLDKGNCRVRLKGGARTVEMWVQSRAAATIYALKDWYGKRLPKH